MTSGDGVAANYEERVIASRWLMALVGALVVLCAVLLVWMLLAQDLESGGRWVGGVTAGATGLVLALVLRWFGVLHVRVTDGALRASFGPFGITLPLEEIEQAAAEPYRWHIYTGWGIRYSTKKRRAYSVPFLATGVEVQMRDGRTVYVSSRQPERLAAALQRAPRSAR